MPIRSLTWDEAKEVRERYTSGDMSMRSLAMDYGVGETSICNILAGNTYKRPAKSMDDYPTINQQLRGVVARNGVHDGNGMALSWWLKQRGCDRRDINRITARRFQYGSYRPSDRAARMLDASPELTPYADTLVAAD